MRYSFNVGSVRFVFFLMVMISFIPLQAAFAEDHENSMTSEKRTSWQTSSERNRDEVVFAITEASWNAEESVLKVAGVGAGRRQTVTIRDGGSGETIGRTRSEKDGRFAFSKEDVELASCQIVVHRYDGAGIPKTVCEYSDEGSNDGDGGTDPVISGNFTLLAWNDLGMHCMDGIDYSVFSILPPYNNLHAQLVRKDGMDNKLITGGVTITYEATAYGDGAINTSSAAPTNYWDYVSLLYEPLFGPGMGVDFGLLGNPTQSMSPAPLDFNNTFEWWEAEAIPTDPYNNDGTKGFYPLVKVVAKDVSGAILASTTTVLPVSDELDCRVCHASGGSDGARPTVGWVNHPDSEKDYKFNILKRHDDIHDISDTLSALAQKGYVYSNSLYETSLGGTPILCSACHGSNALPGTGVAGIAPLTASIHGLHASAVDPTNHQRLDDIANRNSCYRCHPGAETQCLRGAMGAAVNSDGTSMMSCQSCHGGMSEVGTEGRMGWLAEPNCQSCHMNGERLLDTEILAQSSIQDTRFATNPDTPMPGTSLFRFSQGHGGLQCEACHGATHAIYPSAEPGDNIQSAAVQGHIGTIAECSACHNPVPNTADKGPHGLHTVGQSWVSWHEDVAEHGSAQCAACHGQDYRGGLLSKTSMDRTLQVEHGSITFAAGHSVSCYDCHNGPGGD